MPKQHTMSMPVLTTDDLQKLLNYLIQHWGCKINTVLEREAEILIIYENSTGYSIAIIEKSIADQQHLSWKNRSW